MILDTCSAKMTRASLHDSQPVRPAGCGSGGGVVYTTFRIGGGGWAGAQHERYTVKNDNRDFDFKKVTATHGQESRA